jgi:hypothetical protein
MGSQSFKSETGPNQPGRKSFDAVARGIVKTLKEYHHQVIAQFPGSQDN